MKPGLKKPLDFLLTGLFLAGAAGASYWLAATLTHPSPSVRPLTPSEAERLAPSPSRFTVKLLSTEQVEGLTDPLLVDVRSREAFAAGHPAGAVSVPLDAPLEGLSLSRTRPLVLYCDCPDDGASHALALRLQAAGYGNVAVLQGGLPAWSKRHTAQERTP